MTIAEAIKQVLKDAGKPLTPDEIHDEIVAKGHYTFKAKSPKQVVRSTLRRHCDGLDSPVVRKVTYFVVASKEGRVVRYALKRI